MRYSLANTPMQAAIGYVQWWLSRGIGRIKVAEMLTAHRNHGTVLSPAEREEALQAGWNNYVATQLLKSDLASHRRVKHNDTGTSTS